jgi:hypothetical protein
MKECIDCGKRTSARDGICRSCKRARREYWDRERERFRQAKAKVWHSIRERERARE